MMLYRWKFGVHFENKMKCNHGFILDSSAVAARAVFSVINQNIVYSEENRAEET